jgi:zinc protease
VVRPLTLGLLAASAILADCASPVADRTSPVKPPRLPEPSPEVETLSGRPEVPEPQLSRPIAVEQEQLSNGLRIVLAPNPRSPIMAVSLGLLGGSNLDGIRKGQARLAHRTLIGSTAKDARADLAEYLVESGVDFQLMVASDHVQLSLLGLEAQFPDMLRFLSIARANKKFGNDRFYKTLDAALHELWSLKRNPIARAGLQLRESAFGPKHPYGSSGIGTSRTLARVSPNSARSYLSKTICPNNAVLVVAGAMRMPELLRAAKNQFSSWKRCQVVKDVPFPSEPSAPPLVHVIHDPDRAQVGVFAGIALDELTYKDQVILQTVGHILAGSLDARLMRTLRMGEGITYGVHAFTEVPKQAGLLQIYTSLSADHVGSAVQAIQSSLLELISVPPTKAEMLGASRWLHANNLLAARSPLAISEILIQRITADQPLVPVASSPTSQDLTRFVETHLHPDRVRFVLVGDAKVLRPAVARLNLGDIVVQ